MRVSRRRFLAGTGGAGLGLLAGCGPLPGQAPAARVYRLGYLRNSSSPARYYDLLRQALGGLGYIEGQNLWIAYREGEPDQLERLAAELVAMPVDILVVPTGAAVDPARKVSSAIPIVFMASSDPIGQGLVASLARPGGNVTGVSTLNTVLVNKQLELLKQTVLSISRVGIVRNVANPLDSAGDPETAARALAVQIEYLDVRTDDDLERVLAAARGDGVDALLALPAVFRYLARVVRFAAESRLPLIGSSRSWPDAGALMSYGDNDSAVARRVAPYIDRILKGAKPADLPVEQPMTFDFVVNLKTARELGFTFPNEIMLQVTEVVE